jgi:hypothetical protein
MMLNKFALPLEHLERLHQRLLAIEDHLCGARPTTAAPPPPPVTSPDGIFPTYEYYVDELIRVSDRIESALNRITDAISVAAGDLGGSSAKSR